MEKLPDPFSMSEIMGKVEERTPYVVVAFQVILCTIFLRKCTLKEFQIYILCPKVLRIFAS